MEAPLLLQTKFLIPRAGVDQLPRPRLIDRLQRQLGKRLILLSAPPGYGKTTLLADLAATLPRPPAWYQLDATDSDPATFLSYLVEGLRRLAPLNATSALLDNTDGTAAPDRILTVLINELAEVIDGDWLLILEDYHLIANPAVHALVDTLLDNAPPGLRLIISTRSDPPLALARLRARGMLAELRAADLRFSSDEVAGWLARSLPGLPDRSAHALGEKTEGWAAGLQLALTSLSGKDPASAERFIDDLSGAHRFVFEYLAGEVLRRLDPITRHFLLHTSILAQMDAAACNALIGSANAQTMLERIEADNLFVAGLDAHRRWYRYHHLFREFLIDALRREQPDQALALECRAGAYYESRGEFEVALGHYLRGEDAASAARLIAVLAPDYLERGRLEALQRYLGLLPDAVRRERPDFLLYHGMALRRLGQAGAAIARCEEALAAYRARDQAPGVCRALTELAEIARSQGDYRRAQSLASEALSRAPEDDHAARAGALMALAKSEGLLTDTDRGRALAEQALNEARSAGDGISRRAFAALLRSLGQICWWQGDPHAAVHYSQEALQSAPDELSPIAAEALITMATPYLYWGDLDTALRCAERALEIGQRLQLNELLPMAYATLGNALTRRGETSRAESCLRQAMDLSRGLGLDSYARVIAAGYLVYNLSGQGRVDEARQIAESAMWPIFGDPDTYEVYVCRSVLADVALEAGQLDEAERLFDGLREAGARRKFRIPLAMVYFGLAYIALRTGRRERGLDWARESLKWIEPTGAHQLFLDQGDRARWVCQALRESGARSPFLDRVIDRLPGPAASIAVAAPDPSIVRVECLGRFRARAGEAEIDQERWVSTKARDLLAYFATFRRERVPIDRVLDALWPDSTARGKTAFHTALYRLRHALAPDRSTRFILVEAGEYWLDAARFQVDVDDFDAAIAQARAARAEDAARWHARAVDLYRGDYLDNLYYDWLLPERRRVREAYLSALRSLAACRAQAGQLRDAIDLVQRAIQVDPLVEDDHCEAMRYLARLGDRAGVMRQYQHLRQALHDEVGASPLTSTQQLYAALIGE